MCVRATVWISARAYVVFIATIAICFIANLTVLLLLVLIATIRIIGTIGLAAVGVAVADLEIGRPRVASLNFCELELEPRAPSV